MLGCWERLQRILHRKKTLDETSILSTELRRCLSTFNLTFLAFGLMIGTGIFVLTGTMTRNLAGPAVFVSYIISGLATLMSALCYAELGARIPRAGSAYMYTYVAIGEPFAFFIGWNMILEYLVGFAASARGFSGTINAVTGDFIGNWSRTHLIQILGHGDQSYPDLVAVCLIIAFTLCAIYGVRESVTFTNVLSIVLILLLALVVSVGFSLANIDNWTSVPGGFLPYGWSGVLSGSAACFYAYGGFDCITVAGEETKNPSRSIPIALCISTLLVTLIYTLCSATLGLMVPYYLVDISAPFPIAFAQNGVIWATYVVGVGSFMAFSVSLSGVVFVVARTIYAMACDGLLFQTLGKVNPKTQTPIYANLTCGVLASVLVLFVDLEVLVNLVSIGTIFSYIGAAADVLVLRYKPIEECTFERRTNETESIMDGEERLMHANVTDNTGKLRTFASRTMCSVSSALWCVFVSHAFVWMVDNTLIYTCTYTLPLQWSYIKS